MDRRVDRPRSPVAAVVAAAAGLAVVVAGTARADNQPPPAPVLTLPGPGGVVGQNRPPMVLEAVLDPDGDPVTYGWELATDATFTVVEDQGGGAAVAGAVHALFEPVATLGEDTRHCWRAWAEDGQVRGPDGVACFLVSTTNDPPTAPVPLGPDDGAVLAATDVVLGWAAAADPEGAALAYEVELSTAGSWLWPYPTRELTVAIRGAFAEGNRYQWRVRAIDPGGASSPFSAPRGFTLALTPPVVEVGGEGCAAAGRAGDRAGLAMVALLGLGLGLGRRRRGVMSGSRTRRAPRPSAVAVIAAAAALLAGPRVAAAGANHPPGAPAIVSPAGGGVVGSRRPPLVVRTAVDPDGDPLTYDWAVATDDTFAIIVDQGSGAVAQTATYALFELAAALAEDGRRCWRARARDGQAAGAYAVACFVPSAVDQPPTAPVPLRPVGDERVTTTTPVLSWSASVDPDGEPVTYDVEIADGSGVVVASAVGVPGTVAAPGCDLINGAPYAWRVRARDAAGVAGAYSAAATFVVSPPVEECVDPIGRESCRVAGEPTGGALLVLAIVGIAGRRSRRRR